ncbi:MAG: hypothetical protein RML75_04580 [Cyanobacteriota bacterium SKYGB_h_bin112]|nr:hypothetical protein [Cyanobacteriota bacterium SKYGB_h_bin112]
MVAVTGFATISTFAVLQPEQSGRWRQAFLKAAIVHGVAIVLVTELLSVWQALTFLTIAGFWLVGAIVAGFSLVRVSIRRSQRQVGNQLRHQRWRLAAQWQAMPLLERISAIGIVTTLLITLLTALVAVPNNWDAMVYHMPRVMHWIQNRTVAHYPSVEVRQLAFMPGAGYVISHLQLLAGGDRFANMPQWFAFLGCVLGTSLIAEQVSGKRTAWIAALGCASLPMAVMQSTTPQTDLFTAFWLLCLAYFVLRPYPGQPLSSPKHQSMVGPAQDAAWVAAALGLGIVSKPTAWIFSIPLVGIFGLRLLYHAWRSRNPLVAIIQAGITTAIISLVSLVPALPSFWRNIQTFGSFTGGSHGTTNEQLGLVTLVSNLLKNLASNLPIPGFWHWIDSIHTHWLQVSLDDQRFTLGLSPLTAPFSSPTKALFKVVAPHEDVVGYPVHLLLFGMAAVALAWQWGHLLRERYRNDEQWLPSKPCFDVMIGQYPHLITLIGLSTVVVINFLLVCLLLKWQPWINRLLLPIAVLAIPVIAYYVASWQAPWRTLLVSGLSAMAVIYALMPMRHPLIPLPVPSSEQSPSILTLTRQQMYFSGARKDLAVPYQRAVDAVQTMGCTRLGLVLGTEAWEYPFWILLKAALAQPIHIQHLNVQNPSKWLIPKGEPASICAVVAIDTTIVPDLPGIALLPVLTTDHVTVYRAHVN